jgi:hypothetical protein
LQFAFWWCLSLAAAILLDWSRSASTSASAKLAQLHRQPWETMPVAQTQLVCLSLPFSPHQSANLLGFYVAHLLYHFDNGTPYRPPSIAALGSVFETSFCAKLPCAFAISFGSLWASIMQRKCIEFSWFCFMGVFWETIFCPLGKQSLLCVYWLSNPLTFPWSFVPPSVTTLLMVPLLYHILN